eukprot:TRINITY_DN20432_c0_g1_i1.p1 TRINITY_DN20432_c0_g1~~TRINITY_DN20432_c0_g1_i1.p1  ORF type:complete len:187 (+),score=27.90 TRINITY_DN20432_c0_g1_i1:187-747(+)
MSSLYQRANMMATVSLSVATMIICVTGVSTGYFEYVQGMPQPKAVVELNEVHKLWIDERTQQETAMVSIKVDADFTPLFHWNVKQLFVYAVAEYPSDNGTRFNEVFLWDIIVKPQDPKLRFGFRRPTFDYMLTDMKQNLKGTEMTLRLKWMVMPHTGLLYTQRGESAPLRIPANMEHSKPRWRRGV